MKPEPIKRSNIYAAVYGSSREDVAAMLGERGWLTRTSGREEIEARDPVSELLIDSVDPVLVHGPSDEPEKTSGTLIEIFRAEQMRFTIETYDRSGHLIAETRNE